MSSYTRLDLWIGEKKNVGSVEAAIKTATEFPERSLRRVSCTHEPTHSPNAYHMQMHRGRLIDLSSVRNATGAARRVTLSRFSVTVTHCIAKRAMVAGREMVTGVTLRWGIHLGTENSSLCVRALFELDFRIDGGRWRRGSFGVAGSILRVTVRTPTTKFVSRLERFCRSAERNGASERLYPAIFSLEPSPRWLSSTNAPLLLHGPTQTRDVALPLCFCAVTRGVFNHNTGKLSGNREV